MVHLIGHFLQVLSNLTLSNTTCTVVQISVVSSVKEFRFLCKVFVYSMFQFWAHDLKGKEREYQQS
jgi:hypothetical protein